MTAEEERTMKTALRAAHAEIDRLHAVIGNAPHDEACHWGTVMNYDELYPCTCWKAGL